MYGNGRCKISNGTSSKDAKLVESSGSTIDGREFRPWLCKCQKVSGGCGGVRILSG